MKKVLWLAILSSLLAWSTVHADIIADSNVILEADDTMFGYDYVLLVYQDLAGTDPTSISFDQDGESLTLRTFNLDESSDWYFASLNDPFSTTTIEADTFVPFEIDTPRSVGFGEFYMGVNTGLGFDGADPNRDIYGWVHLRNSPAGVEMLGNAMAYGEQGIFIGTLTAVPEPSTAWLGLTGLFVVMLRRRR